MSKDARRRNVVISGHPSKPGVSDTALVDELVETEFGYRPFIARIPAVVEVCRLWLII